MRYHLVQRKSFAAHMSHSCSQDNIVPFVRTLNIEACKAHRHAIVLLQMLRYDVSERTDKYQRAILRLGAMHLGLQSLHSELTALTLHSFLRVISTVHQYPIQPLDERNEKRDGRCTSRASSPYSRSSSYIGSECSEKNSTTQRPLHFSSRDNRRRKEDNQDMQS